MFQVIEVIEALALFFAAKRILRVLPLYLAGVSKLEEAKVQSGYCTNVS